MEIFRWVLYIGFIVYLGAKLRENWYRLDFSDAKDSTVSWLILIWVLAFGTTVIFGL